MEVKLSRFDARSKTILNRVHAHRLAITRTGVAIRPLGGPSDGGPAVSMPPVVGSIAPLVSVAPGTRARAPARVRAPSGRSWHPPNREEILGRLRERAKALASRGGFDYKRAKEMR